MPRRGATGISRPGVKRPACRRCVDRSSEGDTFRAMHIYEWTDAMIAFCGDLATPTEPFSRGVTEPARTACYSPGNVSPGAYFRASIFTPRPIPIADLERSHFTAKSGPPSRGTLPPIFPECLALCIACNPDVRNGVLNSNLYEVEICEFGLACALGTRNSDRKRPGADRSAPGPIHTVFNGRIEVKFDSEFNPRFDPVIDDPNGRI